MTEQEKLEYIRTRVDKAVEQSSVNREVMKKIWQVLVILLLQNLGQGALGFLNYAELTSIDLKEVSE